MEAITTNTSHRFKPVQLSGGWGLSHFWGSSTTQCKYWGQTGVRLSGGKDMVFFPCLGTGRLSYSYSPNQSCLPLSSSWLFPWHLDFFLWKKPESRQVPSSLLPWMPSAQLARLSEANSTYHVTVKKDSLEGLKMVGGTLSIFQSAGHMLPLIQLE